MIRLEGVSRSFAETAALVDVSFEVAAGEILTLTGPSGSGKTTLLRLVAGLETLDRGEIRLGSRTVSSTTTHVPPGERAIAMVFDRPALWPHMTVEENLLFGSERSERAKRDAERLLEALRIADQRRAHPETLSRGQAQRAALARALCAGRPVLLLDEPLAHLDLALAAMALDLIRAAAKEAGASVLHVTHSLTEARAVSDRIARLDEGRLATPSDEVAR